MTSARRKTLTEIDEVYRILLRPQPQQKIVRLHVHVDVTVAVDVLQPAQQLKKQLFRKNKQTG